jgi:hypothetical protein
MNSRVVWRQLGNSTETEPPAPSVILPRGNIYGIASRRSSDDLGGDLQKAK